MTGLLYFIYSILTWLLSKLNKLTTKLNRQIKVTFLIVFVVLLSFIVYYDKTWNPQSKIRIEQASQIILPTKFKVIRDEYQDMIQDYGIIYEIQFDSLSSSHLIQNIKTSVLYTNNVSADKTLHNSLFIHVGKAKAAWFRSNKSYVFIKQEGTIHYSIDFDTSLRVLKYNEYAD